VPIFNVQIKALEISTLEIGTLEINPRSRRVDTNGLTPAFRDKEQPQH
jgi:hypothetical protein